MAEPQLTTLRALVRRAATQGDVRSTIECRHFFSGAAAYANQRIFMTLTPAGLALKLPAGARDRLIEQGGKPLRYFANGPIKQDYVVVPSPFAEDAVALAPWIAESIRFVRAAPTRPRRLRPKAPP